ncbi:MAG TPA: hypothetical protein VGL19_16785 [Polyangiaceae bacterium]
MRAGVRTGEEYMKYAMLGAGLVAAAACFSACSGSHSQTSTPSTSPDAGPLGTLPDAGSDVCTVDSECPAQFCDVLRGKCVSCRTAADCGLNKECTAGSCVDATCVPNSTFCRDGSVSKCGPDGSTSAPTQHCASGQFCLEKDNTAMCSATACTPGAAICSGNVATVCLPDGSGPAPAGNDCSSSKQACYSGGCRDQICTPGKKLCDNGALYFCSDAGTSRALLDSCSAGQVCDLNAGACQPKVCDPGKLGCDSTRVVVCNDAGTGWNQSGNDCAKSNSTCSMGACAAIACTPSQTFCKDNKVSRCSSDGTTSSLVQDCTQYGNWRCATPYGSAQCTPPACAPSSVTCNGDVLSKCKADGTDFEPGGTDCSLTNSVCVEAKCKPLVCTPSAQFCSQGNVQSCDGQGLTSTQSQFCSNGTACVVVAQDAAECLPTPCIPDTDACAGEKLGHCSADGTSVGGTVTDCGAAGKVCTPQGCAASAVSTISTANQLGTGNDGDMMTNIVRVESSRKLTTIEANFSFPALRTLTWVVYEQTNANSPGEYDLAYQKTTTGTGQGFQSSGPVSFELKAGKTYAIGVTVSGGSYFYFYDTAIGAPSLSFAHAIDSDDEGFGTPVAISFGLFHPGGETTVLYNARLTTTPP